jgi:hypothetical protein
LTTRASWLAKSKPRRSRSSILKPWLLRPDKRRRKQTQITLVKNIYIHKTPAQITSTTRETKEEEFL